MDPSYIPTFMLTIGGFLLGVIIFYAIRFLWGNSPGKRPSVMTGIICVPSESWDTFSETLGILSNYSDSTNCGRGLDVNVSFEYSMDFDISYDQVLVKWRLEGPAEKVSDISAYIDREVDKASKHSERAIFVIKGAGSE